MRLFGLLLVVALRIGPSALFFTRSSRALLPGIGQMRPRSALLAVEPAVPCVVAAVTNSSESIGRIWHIGTAWSLNVGQSY